MATKTGSLYLGSIELTGFEVPDRILMGGQQRTSVHELAGGGRVIETLGSQPGTMLLEGRFVGADGFSKAQEVDLLRVSGRPVLLVVAGFSFDVVVAQFEYSYEWQGKICHYRLILERFFDVTMNQAVMVSASDMIEATLNDVTVSLGSILNTSMAQYSTSYASLESLYDDVGSWQQGGAVSLTAADVQAGISNSTALLSESGDGFEGAGFASAEAVQETVAAAGIQSASYDAMAQLTVANALL